MRSFDRLVVGALAVVTLASATAPRTQAFARDARSEAALHFKLDKSDPAQGATLDKAPAQLRFWFTQKPVVKTMVVKLTGPDSVAVALGTASAADSNEKLISVPVTGALADGAYQIAWRAMANDGHVVNGQIAFTVKAHAKH